MNNLYEHKKIESNNVYKKNSMEALTRRWREPQIPIIKNIGINMLSKKIKNVIISNDENESIKNNSNKIK